MSVETVADGLRVQTDWAGKRKFVLVLREATSDADLAQALARHPCFITILEVDVYEQQRQRRTEWDALLRSISARENLETVRLFDDGEDGEGVAPSTLAFLQAIQRNTFVRCVDLLWLHLPAGLSTFVENAFYISSFSLLEDCHFEPGVTRDLAAALQRNKNIKYLRLDLDEVSLCSILQNLETNSYLKTLQIGVSYSSDAFSSTVRRLLESKVSALTRLELFDWECTERLLSTLVPCIIASQSVSELEFSMCNFKGEESQSLLRRILQEKLNLTSLSMVACNVVTEEGIILPPDSLFNQDFMASLCRPDSVLQSFEYQDDGEHGLCLNCRGALLRSIAKSGLERFKLGNIRPDLHQSLTTIVPMLKVRELELKYIYYNERVAHALLDAIRKNFSLRSVVGGVYSVMAENIEDSSFRRELFTEHDKEKLAFYADRNERLGQWVCNPKTVEKKVWPDALKLAEESGPNSIYQGLRLVVESDYVSLPSRSGKRKRPQNDAPL